MVRLIRMVMLCTVTSFIYTAFNSSNPWQNMSFDRAANCVVDVDCVSDKFEDVYGDIRSGVAKLDRKTDGAVSVVFTEVEKGGRAAISFAEGLFE